MSLKITWGSYSLLWGTPVWTVDSCKHFVQTQNNANTIHFHFMFQHLCDGSHHSFLTNTKTAFCIINILFIFILLQTESWKPNRYHLNKKDVLKHVIKFSQKSNNIHWKMIHAAECCQNFRFYCSHELWLHGKCLAFLLHSFIDRLSRVLPLPSSAYLLLYEYFVKNFDW